MPAYDPRIPLNLRRLARFQRPCLFMNLPITLNHLLTRQDLELFCLQSFCTE